MSGKRWLTREDILKDLRQMSGVLPDSDFDQYIVEGERPPPVRREIVDEEEINLLCGGTSTSTIVQGAERTSPDLEGITQMLHLVNELENSDKGETKTLYRNTETDEISISKLNPKVDEFVPSGSGSLRQHDHKAASKPSKPPRNTRNKSPKPPAEVGGSKDKVRTQKSLSEVASDADVLHVLLNEAADLNKQLDVSKMNLNEADKNRSKIVDSPIDDSNEKFDVCKINPNETDKMRPKIVDSLIGDSNEQLDVTKTNLNEIVNMRSKIIDSSNDRSLQKRKVKNIAMASLMKLCSTSSATTATISKTTPPVDILSKKGNGGNEVEAQRISPVFPGPNAVYHNLAVEDSISKVNDWLHSADKPKAPTARVSTGRATVVGGPRHLETLAAKPRPPDSLDSFALKRKPKSAQSVTSGPSEQSISKRELKEPVAFVPSGYASDLLQKYQSFAENTKSHKKEDWGTKLERELKEKEEKMKKKLLEKQNDSSTGTGQNKKL